MIPLHTRLENFLDSVSFVANKDIQKSVWSAKVRGLSSVFSLGELYSQFFDDNDIDDFIENELGSSNLTLDQKNAVRSFRDALDSFSKGSGKPGRLNNEEVLNDPEWDEIVELAKITLVVFQSETPPFPTPRSQTGDRD